MLDYRAHEKYKLNLIVLEVFLCFFKAIYVTMLIILDMIVELENNYYFLSVQAVRAAG